MNLQLKGTITLIEEEKIINNKNGNKFRKVVLTLETMDNQKLFIEVRNEKIAELELKNINLHDFVEVSFVFKGSIKNEKRYNNILLDTINKANW